MKRKFLFVDSHTSISPAVLQAIISLSDKAEVIVEHSANRPDPPTLDKITKPEVQMFDIPYAMRKCSSCCRSIRMSARKCGWCGKKNYAG